MNASINKVIIIGGGPVGLTLSIALSRYGIPSIVLEARDKATSPDESRAITWMPRGLELLEWLGIYHPFYKKGVLRTCHQFESRRGKLLSWSFEGIASPYPFSLQLPQHDTEMILEEAARSTGYVEINRGHKVIDIGQTEHAITVKVQCHDRIYELESPWGVGCDGAKSLIREKLNIGKTWRDYGMDSAVADFELECGLSQDISNIVLDPLRPYGFFYFAPGRWRLIYRINKEESRSEATSPEFIHRLLKEKLPDAKVKRLLWASAFRLGQGQSDHYRKGRWLLAGDAAHAMGPSAGAGMMVGVLGAWRLAWRLALAMQNHPDSDKLLEDYSKEQREGANEIQNNNAMIFRNMAITHPLLAAGRAFVLRNFGRISSFGRSALEKEALLSQALPVSGASDQYVPSGVLSLSSYGPWQLGKRVPYIAADKGPHPLSGMDRSHTLISIGKHHPEQEQRLFENIMKEFSFPAGRKLVHPNVNSSYRKLSNDFVFALVRPDQHVVSIFKM